MELTEPQLRELEQLLLTRKAALEEHLRSSADSARPVSLDAPIGRLSRVDALQQQQLARALRGRDEVTRTLLSSALERLRQGSYGSCARCDEPIGYGRLRSRPEVPLCLRCTQGLE